MRKAIQLFGLVHIFCFTLLAYSMPEQDLGKINLEYVNFHRIEYAVKKYERLHNKFKWNTWLKYSAIGIGCAGITAFVVSNVTAKPIAAGGVAQKPEHTISKEELEIKRAALEVECLEKKAHKGSISGIALNVLKFGFYTAISTTFWAFFNKGSSFLSENFGGLDLQDSELYKQKHDKINGLMKHLGISLLQYEKDTDVRVDAEGFDLMFTDLLLDHTTLVRWFEDIIGFIKCAVILSEGDACNECAYLQKDIIALSNGLNRFSDDLSLIVNCAGELNRVALLEQAVNRYLVFCKQFSKFIYDYGFYLYEQDFLHK
jgi:hypothetical protein